MLIFALDCSAYLVSSFSKELTQKVCIPVCPASVWFHTLCIIRSHRGCVLAVLQVSSVLSSVGKCELCSFRNQQTYRNSHRFHFGNIRLVSVFLFSFFPFFPLSPFIHPHCPISWLLYKQLKFLTGLSGSWAFFSWFLCTSLVTIIIHSKNLLTSLPSST